MIQFFGKTMENERKIKLIKLVTAERKLSKEPNIYINNRNEKNSNISE